MAKKKSKKSKKKKSKKKSKKNKKLYKCDYCGKAMKSRIGKYYHERTCKERYRKKSEDKKGKKERREEFPTLKIEDRKDIARDFSIKVYEKFDKIIKCIILFGSQTKNTAVSGSDIDLIIVIDDASIEWDQELISWYREELGKIIRANPYRDELHINSIKLSTWWKDLMRGDPIIINIIRYGTPIIDFGGFYSPLKILLDQGMIKSTPEAIYAALERAPNHLSRSIDAELGAIEGVYWAMVDSAQAALMAARQVPPSPEHISSLLKEIFVDTKNLKMKYVKMFRDLYDLHSKIKHGQITNIHGKNIDQWQEDGKEFMLKMGELVKGLIKKER